MSQAAVEKANPEDLKSLDVRIPADATNWMGR